MRLYSALIEILKLQGVKNLYSYVTVPNIKSEKLHCKLDFKSVGKYHNTGFKNGKWLDVEAFEKQIGTYNTNPMSVTPISELSTEKLNEIFNKYSF